MWIIMEFSKSLYLKLQRKFKKHYHPEVDHQDSDYREALGRGDVG